MKYVILFVCAVMLVSFSIGYFVGKNAQRHAILSTIDALAEAIMEDQGPAYPVEFLAGANWSLRQILNEVKH